MTKYLTLAVLVCGFFSAYISQTKAYFPYFGTKIGSLKQLHHAVSGDVYAVDSRTLFLKNFNYDGGAPAAYFYVGNSKKPTGDGSWRLRDEKGGTSALARRYRNSDITLLLPEGKTLRDIKWFSVWCDEFSVNFGDVSIPANLDFPRPQKIAALRGVHGVSSDNIVIVDAQTFLIPNFTYDGEAPDAKFWVGQGAKPTAQGLRIPDENGKTNPLRRYDKKTIVLTLPGFLTVFDIGHFGIWCEAFTVDFGNVRIPEGLNVPPSLKMLGISPQSKLNCEVLHDDLAFEVRWAVAGESIVVQLVAKLADNEYMSFGISPNPQHTQMIGADAVVAWVDKQTGKGFAEDYFLDAKSQCSGRRGSCPDVKIQDNTNSIRLLNAAMVNGYSIVTYQRSLKGADRFDLPISINSTQAIIWAIGPLNERKEVSFHSVFLKDDHLVNFGRQPTWNCPSSETEKDDEQEPMEAEEEFYDRRPQRPAQALQAETTTRRDERPQRRPVPTPKPVAKVDGAWEIPPIQCFEPEDGVFYAQMGPTGGKHGYPAITGHVGWGISWYINGLLIPEIHVVRGKSYTFVVEGGNNPDTPAKYHPFYITDDPVGGYEYKTDEEKASVKIYAGIHRSRTGKVTPIGVGRICNWTPDPDGPSADEFQSFGAYQRTLTLKCDKGEPGVINWTPDRNTPDTVYYHCFTHRHLGWKIHVHDRCDEGQASEIDEVIAEPPEEYIAEPSIRHETRVGPNGNFLLKHQTDLIKNHNMNGAPPKLSFELTKSSEITKLIADGIRAAEALEESISKGIVPPTQIPQVFTSATEILRGEMSAHSKNITSVHIERPLEHLELPNIGPSAFLRPPQNVPLFRPMKPNARRPSPIKIDRRPLQHLHRPVILPQPSVIVNHYRKPVPAIMRPFIKEKPFPIKQLAPVLLLGQPSEIRKNDPILKAKQKPNGIIGVPYFDHHPQDSKLNYAIVFNGPSPFKQSKKPIANLPVLQDKSANKTTTFKKPFEIKEIKEDIFNMDGLRPAINEGFKPDTVVVENGFKPIVRRRTDINIGEDDERTDRLVDDPGAEIDNVMETDTLFLSQESATNAKQSFEPMFIPSPLDKTNATKIRQTVSSLPLGDLTNMDVEDGEDKVAVAAERIDTYYLPTEKHKHKDTPHASRTVVAYDGKAVIDASLVQPPQFDSKENSKESGHSKIDELIRNTPQFGPFHGEIPPLNQDYFTPVDNKTANSKDHHHQHPITEYSNPLGISNKNHTQQISTKLTLLKPHK